MKRLILNADDFGLTAGVNQAILALNRQGKLTSTTLMAKATATAKAAAEARQTSRLGVGCHVVLVDGSPVLPAAQLPTLTDPATGRFRSTLGRFVEDLFLGRIRTAEIQAEAEAQLGLLKAMEIQLTHLDTHKHTHMFPRILAPLLAAAQHVGLDAIRNPFEPEWSIAATPAAPAMRRMQVRVLRQFRKSFLRAVTSSGLTTTDGAIGVLATGTLNSATLSSLLLAIPDGTWELVTHPGSNDADLANAGTRLLTSRETEIAALQTVTFPPEIELIHFGQLAFIGPRTAITD